MKKVIEINNLSYSYPDGIKALENINLDIFEGDSLAIIGPNGAGKSTLLLHFNGILGGNGFIRVLGMEMKGTNFPVIRSKVGLVFQDPDNQLFMPTVFEDVSFGPLNMGLTRKEVDVQASRALEKVDMLGFETRLSHHLSLGEKKRISIATVFSMNPEIIVMDEPSSNLDPKHRRDIINLLTKFKLTKIIATHDLNLVLEVCAKVVLIDKGKIAAAGDTLDILKDKALLEAHNLEFS
ncbi:MAG: ABC transporter ATP-binding protein [Candidatus Omnitrophota bacterium]